MPCYYWKGISLNGSICKGNQFAKSVNDLEQELFLKNIGLFEYSEKKILLRSSVSNNLKELFIENVYTLLKAQIRLHQALELTVSSIFNNNFKQITHDISFIVLGGKPLHKALELYPKIFDTLTVNIISVGEISSNLTNAFEQLVNHNNQIREFKSKIKSVLFIPVLTFIFFGFVMIIFFIFVVPRFQDFFKSFNAPLPYVTQIILSISAFLRSYSIFYLFALFPLIYFILKGLAMLVSPNFKDKFVFYVPVLNNISLNLFRLRFLQILALSLSSGMHLLNSLNLAYNISRNTYLKNVIKQLILDTENGRQLSAAMTNSILNDAEIIALIKVGESSGDLAQITSKALDIYQKKFYSSIDRVSSLVHPIVLLVLGCLIAVSIFSIYVPIFTLTTLIN